MTADITELKKMAGERAAEWVESGMVVGLGTGSTAVYATRAIGQRLQDGRLHHILGIPTSEQTARQAQQAGIPLTTLDNHPMIDLTIDGADEIDPHLNLIKGLGGALLREKIVAAASKRLIIVSDARKVITKLGTLAPLPVEVIPFARRPVYDFLTSLGAQVALRPDRDLGQRPFLTDEGNIILDCTFPQGIDDPTALAQTIIAQPGVVEHGLFLNLASLAVIAAPDGLQILKRSDI
ncbi:MAG: ribose-5-phosphate isomerase RpiA [Chloroflexi bacterium]|nr:ribose-5-phosphate isomerase RpiA [Chloroflexota bacterium]MBP7041665.1 ribose-5-phosphate isomerase RpiA [Chloroflexota bacterium]